METYMKKQTKTDTVESLKKKAKDLKLNLECATLVISDEPSWFEKAIEAMESDKKQ